MKNLFLLAILFVSFQAFSQQNSAKKNPSPENKADAAVKRWTNVLNLTPEQQPQVRAVFLERVNKMEAIRSKYQNSQDKKAMHQEMKAMRENSDKSIQQILTPDQYAQLQKLKEEKRKKAQERKGKTKTAPATEEKDELVED